MVYPDSFPSTRPAIYAPELKLDRHQNPYGGNLCVLPRSSVHWRPSMTAAELVNEQVPYLVQLVREGGDRLREGEEPQGEPVSSFLSYLATGGVVVPSATLSMKASHVHGRMSVVFAQELGWLTHVFERATPDSGWIGQAILMAVRGDDGTLIAEADSPLANAFDGPDWPGRWVRLDRPPSSDQYLDLLREAIDAWNDLERREMHKGYEIIGILFPEEVQQGVWEDAWIFLVLEGPPKQRIALLRSMRYSEEDLTSRIPELVPMRSATVSVIGLGTLGSEIAWQMAKAQCGRLRLADFDHIDAAATVRWSNGLPAAGGIKPHFLKSAIEGDYPYVYVDASTIMVGATPTEAEQPSERERLNDWLREADVVLDATAEQNVRRVIAFAAHPERIPQVFVWSIDGYGGVVAAIVPGETGCLLCLERALSPTSGYITAPSPPYDPDRLRIQPRGCADRTFTGALVDLTPLALEASRMAFAVVCSVHPGGYPRPVQNVMTAKFRESDGTLSVPTWVGYDLPPNPDECLLCARVA